MGCDDCHRDKVDVSEANCPYEEELNGIIIECKLWENLVKWK